MKIQLDPSAAPFDLEQTLECGQAFRWKKFGDWWYGVVRKKIIKIRQKGDKLEFDVFPEKADAEFVTRYFRLDDDLPFIYSIIDRDQNIRQAIQQSYGLRITRQEPWECLISYICATYKNIPAIKKIILNLAREFGEKTRVDRHEFYTFPEPHQLAGATLEELKKCNMGYRAKYVLETSKIINNGEFDLETLKTADYEEAKRELLWLPGVGQKVADCVVLFSLGKLEAFPVDTRMKRIILNFYSDHFENSFIKKICKKPSLTPSEYEEISSFGREYFGRYAGYAQEHLFHYRHLGASCSKGEDQ